MQNCIFALYIVVSYMYGFVLYCIVSCILLSCLVFLFTGKGIVYCIVTMLNCIAVYTQMQCTMENHTIVSIQLQLHIGVKCVKKS